MKEKKHRVALKGEKNDIGLILLDLLMIWESDWLKETWGGGASRGQQRITDLYRERRMTSVCADMCTHPCTRMLLHRRIEFLWRVET